MSDINVPEILKKASEVLKEVEDVTKTKEVPKYPLNVVDLIATYPAKFSKETKAFFGEPSNLIPKTVAFLDGKNVACSLLSRSYANDRSELAIDEVATLVNALIKEGSVLGYLSRPSLMALVEDRQAVFAFLFLSKTQEEVETLYPEWLSANEAL